MDNGIGHPRGVWGFDLVIRIQGKIFLVVMVFGTFKDKKDCFS